MAEKTEAQKKAQKEYMKKFTRLEVRVTPEESDIIKAHAERHSESLNGFINRAITETMERDDRGEG